MPTTWIIQRYLGKNTRTLRQLLAACAVEERPCVQIDVVPYSTELPMLPDLPFPFVFYGYSTLIQNVFRSDKWRPGIFFDPELFRPTIYRQRYGALYLNEDMDTGTVGELDAKLFAPEIELFIKPDDDLKGFTGQVMAFGAFRAWFHGFQETQSDLLTENSRVVWSMPRAISAEWRLFLVDQRVVAASQYAPEQAAGSFAPPEVREFAEKAAAIWSPSAVFVMDIALVPSGLKIIELNCFSGSGFYYADVPKIVRSVSRYQESLAAC